MSTLMMLVDYDNVDRAHSCPKCHFEKQGFTRVRKFQVYCDLVVGGTGLEPVTPCRVNSIMMT
jgi:hypothetical protein